MNRKGFVKIWRFLCERWNRTTDEREAIAYYDWLARRGMDYDSFVASAETLWASREFFPRPVDFLLVEAGKEWGKVLTILGMSSNERVEAYKALSNRARDAFNSLGGSEGLNRMAVPQARRAFMEAFEAVVVAEALDNTGALASATNRGKSTPALASGSRGTARKATGGLAPLQSPTVALPSPSLGSQARAGNPESPPE